MDTPPSHSGAVPICYTLDKNGGLMHRICCGVWSEDNRNTSSACAVVDAMLDSQMTDLRMTEAVLVPRFETITNH